MLKTNAIVVYYNNAELVVVTAQPPFTKDMVLDWYGRVYGFERKKLTAIVCDIVEFQHEPTPDPREVFKDLRKRAWEMQVEDARRLHQIAFQKEIECRSGSPEFHAWNDLAVVCFLCLNIWEPKGLRYFQDVNGENYLGNLNYFQPQMPHDMEIIDRNGHEWPSYAVWLNLNTCKDLFPNCTIKGYVGDEIEEPMFVDKPEK